MTEPLLKTRYVFVDTQAFYQQRLKFDHPTLKRLKELCASRMLQLVVTETVIGEVKSKITEHLADATKALGQFHKEASLLEGFLPEQFAGLFCKPNEAEFVAAGCTIWDKFLADTKATIIPASVVNSKQLLDLYFASQAPFGNGKKKNEFPDAISTLSLEYWATENKQQIYVISGDSDLENWCKGQPFTIHLKSLGEFIDLYNRAEEKLTVLAHALFAKEEKRILDVVKDSFLKCGFQYADNWEAEVEDVDFKLIHIDEVNVIEVDEERAILALDGKIRFSAVIDGPDYDSGIWDSEDKTYAYLPTFRVEKTFNEHFDISLEMIFSLENKDVLEIGEVLFDDSRDITLRDDDGYPYK